VKALRIEDLVASKLEGLRTREINARHAASERARWSRQVGPLFNAVALSALFLVGGREVMRSHATVGTLYSFLAIELLLRRALSSVVAAVRDVGDLGPVLERLEDVELAPLERDTGEFRVLHGAIEVANVKVRLAPKAPLALDGVSLRVEEGEHICLVGPSGSGKSTLLRVLTGLVAPLEGGITFDGTPAAEIGLASLRGQVALVTTDRAFFDGTIRENLLLGRSIAESRIREALSIAHLDDVVTDIDAPLGAAAAGLSGGQAHRLLLARALLGYPRVLLLDEITTSLDPALEAGVLGRVRARGLTIVSVAHRQSALRTADRIVVMEGGQVRATGTFDELSGSSLLFRRLARVEVGR
jgi:ABC-type bacteriocin/lantibiotic exporter with double-glycine peptidase domain